MICLDTSILVAALSRERRTKAVQTWLSEQPPEQLFISEWVITEFSSALSLKVRMNQLTMALRADVLAGFTQLVEESFSVLPLGRDDFRVAARFCDRHDTGLRAGDALHLACASNHGAQLISLDRLQVKAATTLGVSAALF
jgi:predicted nucleic acid-binding protein